MKGVQTCVLPINTIDKDIRNTTKNTEPTRQGLEQHRGGRARDHKAIRNTTKYTKPYAILQNTQSHPGGAWEGTGGREVETTEPYAIVQTTQSHTQSDKIHITIQAEPGMERGRASGG